ncbi:heat shock 70 kDa protein 12A [Rhizoctonia solani 123E]|uniref:Heat shock 70 kDa protein 12A n=1 Tax=Rhizoctonia solani 123E TaxID=1423351 RepID=A0A074S3L5_9AGAM|nr:heat shock 70 kDa protein 12A [Rhizoctonia solani 123E]
MVTALPPGVSLEQIYSDFLRYLLKHTKAYFEDRVLDGKHIWERYSPKMEVVVAHPNGWGLRQQQFLRTATIAAGLAGEDTASSKVRFVTEAEASVHFCIHHANAKNVLKPGTSFGVCDAGGSTVDSTMYMVVSESPLKLKEQRDSGCVQAGAIFVDYEMQKYLESTLRKAELDADDVEFYTKTGVKDFESYAKRTFQSKTAEYAVLVADSRFNKPDIKTRRGRMTVPGSVIQKCFDTCITEIKQSVDRQMAGLKIPHVLLVGGLGENGYVRNELKKHYEPRGSKIVLSDESSAKAVADGAVIWGANCSVVSRAPRYSFGIHEEMPYRPMIDDPVGRKPYTTFAGDVRVKGGWSEIVPKGKVIDFGVIYRREYHFLYNTPTPKSRMFQVKLVTYSGDDNPEWLKDPHGNYLDGFQSVCTLTANLQDTQGAMVALWNPSGSKYWALGFSVCIRFSGTELESFLEWKENGVKHTGPLSIVLPEEPSLG